MKILPNVTSAHGNGQRLTGMARFTELLEKDFSRMFLVNLLTLLLCLPYLAGITFSILTSSVLVLLAGCVLGGALAGPAIACMYDTVLRSLRDAGGKWTENYKRAWKQNARGAVLPGIIFGTFAGFYLFMGALFLWASTAPTLGTVLVYLLGILLLFIVLTVYWPMLVLFDQPWRDRLRNCLLFSVRYLWKTLGCALLHFAYWAAFIVLLPWSAVVLLLTGFWFIIFLTCFLLYPALNEAFSIEEEIAKAFPEQVPFYEDDETWLKRKAAESRSAQDVQQEDTTE